MRCGKLGKWTGGSRTHRKEVVFGLRARKLARTWGQLQSLHWASSSTLCTRRARQHPASKQGGGQRSGERSYCRRGKGGSDLRVLWLAWGFPRKDLDKVLLEDVGDLADLARVLRSGHLHLGLVAYVRGGLLFCPACVSLARNKSEQALGERSCILTL